MALNLLERRNQNTDGEEMSFVDHLEELRWHIVRAVIAIVVCAIAVFVYIDEVMDPHKQEDIHDYFMNADTDSLEAALNDNSIADYSEEEIRMMRIKFMSEYAN